MSERRRSVCVTMVGVLVTAACIRPAEGQTKPGVGKPEPTYIGPRSARPPAEAGKQTALRGPGPCIPCPGGAVQENEPACGLPTDTVNGGCFSEPEVFTPIAIGTTVCGTGAFDGLTRDTDWYRVTLAQPTQLTWSVTAEFGVLIGMVASPCPQNVFISGTERFGAACAQVGSVKCLLPGTYYMFVAPDFTAVVPCGGPGNTYVATLSGVVCSAVAPSNDTCSNATTLTVGVPAAGDTTYATPDAGAPFCGDAIAYSGVPAVWYKFTGTGQTMTASLCGSSYDTQLLAYCSSNANPCGALGSLQCITGNDDACGQQSSLTFCTAAGQVYYLMVTGYGAVSPVGTFTLNLSAGVVCTGAPACAPATATGACCANGACSITTQAACAGTYLGDNSSCAVGAASPNASIPDNSPAGVSSTIVLSQPGTIVDLNVGFIITHTWQGDISVFLSRNGGPEVSLINRPGVPETTFGFDTDNYGNFTGGAPMIIDDEAALVYGPPDVAAGVSNVAGSWKPDGGSLSAFDGQPISGNWTLRVVDGAGGDFGALRSWHIAAAGYGPCPLGSDCFTRAAGQQAGLYVSGGGNSIADSTECVANWDRNGAVEPSDIASYVNTWLYSVSNPPNTYGDVDCNGLVEPADIAAFVNLWLAGLTPGSNGCP